jgi:ABC-type multidrug transport system fused ATPase/permease subunit
VTRVGATLFQELRNAIFASVAQKAIRRVACGVYEHLLRLDLNFHLSRQTGGLTRAIDRGTKGISFLLTSMVFHVIPTALEIGLVCGILVRSRRGGYPQFKFSDTSFRLTSMDLHLQLSRLPRCLRTPFSPLPRLRGGRNFVSKQMPPTIKQPQLPLIH